MLRRFLLATGLAATLAAAGCAHAPSPADAQARAALAPTGTLRVALYRASPTSMVVAPNGERAGITYELGQLAGRRLGVPVQYVEYARAAEVFDAVKSGKADMTFTNASEARMREADFTPPVIRLESGYLVTLASRIKDVAAIDRPGVKVGVAQGGSSDAALHRALKQATVVPLASLDIAAMRMRGGELDAFASNKGILFELGDKVPGSHVLAGHWGFEALGIAVPKGRPAAATEWMRSFAASLKGSAELQGMATRAGLRGVAPE